MASRLIGSFIALASLVFFVWHIARGGSEPHWLWAMLAGICLILGLWLALPGQPKKKA